METLFPGLNSAPNLHPLAVHFPIAFWIAATGALIISLLRRQDDTWRFGLWLHTAAVAGAALAVTLGFWATAKIGHDSPGHGLVHTHRNIMLVATGLAVALTCLAWWRRSASWRWKGALLGASILLVGILTVGADRGAELVFRYGVGVANEAPPDSDHENADGHDTEHERPPHPHGASPSDTASDHHAGQLDGRVHPNPVHGEAAVNENVGAVVPAD